MTLRTLLPLSLAAACTFAPPPAFARPPLPLPATARAAAVALPRLVALAQPTPGRWCGELADGGEVVRFQLLQADPARPGRRLVLLVPILAGGDELMAQVARRLGARGFDVAFCERAGSALQPPQRGEEIEQLFHRTVLHQRLLLRWLAARTPAPAATFVLGISMGGIVSTVLAALEPALDGVAVCLSGGDLGDLVQHSSEGRVQRWRRWRLRHDGIGDDQLRREFAAQPYEPLSFAPAVPTAKVLFVSAEFDTVVPRRNQDLLWEALGRPARYQVPFGHYTAALAIDTILAAAADHFDHRRPDLVP
ncbi:MAG: alpha/beta hydrolase [Planctomycetes bacterium]|nr:alpha/beta hydrolase [Planctomycetota bacterium]